MASLISALKQCIPRPVRRWLRNTARPPLYTGQYQSWAEAAGASSGYDDQVIFEKTLSAARKVRDDEAAWERDTVLFFSPAANQRVLDSLRTIASSQGGVLNLVDFGGALGSTWWQHRQWLADISSVRWSIVEQEQWVLAGQREFTTGPLRFYRTLAECCAAENPQTILLSSVLPYIPDPHSLLAEIRGSDLRHLIVDRTGFTARGPDRLTVQHVPKEIYAASYPCWFFNRSALLAPFLPEWQIDAEWKTDDEVDIDAEHRGFMLTRNPPA